MKTFNVYKHPTKGIEAVKVGFSWPAFFFGFFWMLVKKLWAYAGTWFVAYIVLSLIEKVTDLSGEGGAQALVYLIRTAGYFTLWLVPAFNGNKWREGNLSRRGYELFTTAQAETPEKAVEQTQDSATKNNDKSQIDNNDKTFKPTAVENKKIDVNKIYEKISEEIDNNSIDKGLWLKLFSENNGDTDKTKIQYIKERFKTLKNKEIENFQLAIKKQEEAERKILANPDLVRAVWDGNISKARNLLDNQVKPIGTDEYKNFLLEIAERNKDKVMIDLIKLHRNKINLTY